MASPSASSEHVVDPCAIPRRRESRYRPGEATRKHSGGEKENISPVADQTKPPIQVDKPLPPVKNDDHTTWQEERWIPPPPANRTDTPASVDLKDFKALGGFRHGSLRIVNGRTSPVLSELSRQLISRQLRDVSSEYADSTYSKDNASEGWEDDRVAVEGDEAELDEPQTPTRATTELDSREVVTPTGKQESIAHATPVQTPARSSDRTSRMAQAYMNELGSSPFSYGSVSPVSTGSVVYHKDEHASEVSVEEPVERGRDVRRHSVESEQPSIVSKSSVPETVKTRDLVFSSALEYQAPYFEPPCSPQRGISPDSVRPNSGGGQSGKFDSGYDSGASMFSVNLDAVKLRKQQTPLQIVTTPVTAGSAIEEQNAKMTLPAREQSPGKFGRFFSFRPAARKFPASSPVVPTLQTIRPTTGTTDATPIAMPKVNDYSSPSIPRKPVESPKKPVETPRKSTDTPRKSKKEKERKEKEEKELKSSKKLHKLRSRSQSRAPKEIVVQRVPSCESELDLPPIPVVAKDNLHRRSLLVPELEKTFNSQFHIKDQPSVSNLSLPVTTIRFPSPPPEVNNSEKSPRSARKERDRSRSRSRSKSHRRSFLDYFRSDKDSRLPDGEATKADTDLAIADFGNVVASLGANPYSITHSRPHTPDSSSRSTNVTAANPRQNFEIKQTRRLSMSDEQASEFARTRSHSFNGRDVRGDRKHIANEHGLVLGKYLRASTTEEDVPPIPPLPTKEQLKRISQRLSTQSPYSGAPVEQYKPLEDSPSFDRYTESSPAPLPPAHSPRPSFSNHRYDDCAVEDDQEFAPPPPSHSPAPRDVEDEQEPENPWEGQANIWRARRKSANEALKYHRQSLETRREYFYSQVTSDEKEQEQQEASYPVISPSHLNHGGVYDEPQTWTSDHNDRDYHPYIQRSQTWHNGTDGPMNDMDENFKYSQSSFQSRQLRHHDWDETQDQQLPDMPAHYPIQENGGSRQSNHQSVASMDSHQSFYSHRNHHIDRPFDAPPRMSSDSYDGYGYQNQYYTPQTSPVRGRGRNRDGYDDNEYNQYDDSYDHPDHDDHEEYSGSYNIYNQTYTNVTPKRPLSQQYPYFQPSPDLSRHTQPSHHYSQSHAPPSPAISRPASERSLHLDAPLTYLGNELRSDIESRPSQAPEFGRYSGGFGYGYEGRNKGFGGSAGTRSASGKADGMWKGVGLRGDYGVDLADVPFIGVVKKVR